MVCLYETILDNIREIIKKNKNDPFVYPDWNWFGYKLTLFMFYKSHKKGTPLTIPNWYGDTIWSSWFDRVMAAMKNEFFDATSPLVLRCLQSPPDEIITTLAFEATPEEFQLEFHKIIEEEVAKITPCPFAKTL
tara:strand:+ start:149 stop:550 length:402 start_codon:yes stop_codon:yes gene_type:complete